MASQATWTCRGCEQDLEDKVSGQALDTAQAHLAAAHDQVAKLQTQLHQAQARAAGMTIAEAQVTQLRSQLQQQQAITEDQATAVAALTGGFDQERASWQEERSSLLARVKVAVPSLLWRNLLLLCCAYST